MVRGVPENIRTNHQSGMSGSVYTRGHLTHLRSAYAGMILAWLSCLSGCVSGASEPGQPDVFEEPADSAPTPSVTSLATEGDPVECPDFSTHRVATELPPGCPVLRVPLDDPHTAATLMASLLVGRFLFEGSVNMGLAGGDASCPQASVSETEELFSGGCVSELGYHFEGELLERFVQVVTTANGETTTRRLFTARDWRVEGSSQGFRQAAMHGELSYLQSTERVEENPEPISVRRWDFDGAMTWDAGDKLFQVRAFQSLSGRYYFEWRNSDRETGERVDRHRVVAELYFAEDQVITADIQLDVITLAGGCYEYGPDSFAVLSDEETTVEFLHGRDPDPCDPCMNWAVNGVEQPEQACVMGR